MEVNFGRRRPFSLGIEEELQLLNGETFELASRFDEVHDAAGRDPRIKPELMQSVVEAATHPANSVAEAIQEARELRARLRAAAAEHGVLIASAGTHPFSRYEHQEISEGKRYQQLVEAMQWVAERELIFGLHIHVGLERPEQAIAVANALRTWLPELLALSANSPFWQGRDTGLASSRIKVFDSFPRSGLPPALGSFEEFELLVDRGAKTGSFPDYTYLWWDLRPHPNLGTIEIRICDAQTRIESVGAIVALVQSLVAALARRFEADGALPIQPVTLIEENRWRAARHGLDADLIDLDKDEERPAREALLALVELGAEEAGRLGCSAELAAVERLCGLGGASEQRRVYGESGSPLELAQWLAEATVSDL